MKLLAPLFITLTLFSSNAYSKNFMKISRYEVKNIINLLNLSDDDSIADCKSDSDCGPGQICVGIGLCVPKASVHSMRGQLPNLLKRYTPRF